MAVYTLTSQLGYGDVDHSLDLNLRGAMGLMQEAAILHSDQVGYSVEDVERTRVIWMLSQWRIRLEKPLHWKSSVTVRTWPRTLERATSLRDFEILDEAGERAAIGESAWALVSADTGRITRITPEIIAAYDLTDRPVFHTPLPKLPAGDGPIVYTGSVQRRDIDTNHHVNNRVYLDYALEALPPEAAERGYRELHIRYHQQMLPGQEFCCRYTVRDNAQVVDICSADGAHVHGTVMLL